MIVNSIVMNHQTQIMEPPAAVQCENFYLKRKLDNFNDSIDNNGHLYVYPSKKRNIQYFPINDDNNYHHLNNDNFDGNNIIVGDNNGINNQQQQQMDTNNLINNCAELQFNLSNNNFVNDCQTIEFLNYDNNLISPVQNTITTTTTLSSDPVTASAIFNDSNNDEQFDTTNWQNSDLLELDQKYNSVNLTTCFEKDEHQIHQNIQMHHQTQHANQLDIQQNDNNQHLHIVQQEDIHHQQSTIVQTHHHQEDLLLNQQQNLIEKTMPNTSQTDSDFEDKNLSWLFNFKLDELPHLSPEVQNCAQKPAANNNNNINNNCNNHQNNLINQQNNNKLNKIHQSKTGKKVDELIKEVTAEMAEENDINNVPDNNIIMENTTRMPKKPPFTYTELIEYALEDKGELTVSGIYQWISDRFPFYKSNDDRWKNSVRHNLSINPHFRKGVKAPQGAGHLWTISSRDSEENALAWEHKKQRLELFFKMEELQIAKHQKIINQQEFPENNNNNNNAILYDEAATAAASITQQMRLNDQLSPDLRLCHTPPINNNDHNNSLPIDNLINDEILKKSAGEILNGIRRNVEVQPINSTISTFHDSLLETEDYLNPITKDDAVTESGLRNEFYVTEIDPIELGINMSNVEEEVLFNEEFNLNFFGINSSNDIVA